jgi:hypothetical protein
MKSKRFFTKNGYDIVYGVSPVLIDPEETKNAIAQALGISPSEVPALTESLDNLTRLHAVYPDPGPGEIHISDDAGSEVELRLAALEEHTKLTLEDEVIPDWEGTKYHLKTDGVWAEEEITDVGVSLPEGAVLPEDLTKEQHEEIAAQKDAERIAALDPEKKAEELRVRLESLADEADRLSRRAAIQGTDFDAAAWYQEHKAPVELKYA